MSWPHLGTTRVANKKGWTDAKGTIAKLTVGKTGITEKIVEIQRVFGSVDQNKFGQYYVSKEPAADKKAALDEIAKLEKVKPKVAELMALAKTAKDKNKTLPSGAKTYLDQLAKDCAEFPTKLAEKKTLEEKMYKEAKNV